MRVFKPQTVNAFKTIKQHPEIKIPLERKLKVRNDAVEKTIKKPWDHSLVR